MRVYDRPAVAIIQSCYIPWKGYFDLINSVDDFVLLDDVQYTRRDWRNRNKIKTPSGPAWISVPVEVSGKRLQKIKETRVATTSWASHHRKCISHNYPKARFFPIYKDWLWDLYDRAEKLSLLSEINRLFIAEISTVLGIKTRLHSSSMFDMADGKSERLLSICEQLNATTYVSGPSARCYLDVPIFSQRNIAVKWFDYGAYREYSQLFPPFHHNVTVLDLILNEGPNAAAYMNSFAPSSGLLNEPAAGLCAN